VPLRNCSLTHFANVFRIFWQYIAATEKY